MAIATAAVNDDRLVLRFLQHTIEVPIVMREIVSRQIERARHVTLFEK